jgi:hypothetical protein
MTFRESQFSKCYMECTTDIDSVPYNYCVMKQSLLHIPCNINIFNLCSYCTVRDQKETILVKITLALLTCVESFYSVPSIGPYSS